MGMIAARWHGASFPLQGQHWRARGIAPLAASRGMDPLTRPYSELDVDRELWELLDLAQDDELQAVHDILYGASPLSPLLKSILKENEPAAIARRGRASIMHRIESRFRFLAADSGAMLRGYRPSYRETLLCIRDRLEVHCPSGLDTQDLETEIFLHLLQQHKSALNGLAEDAAAAAAKATASSSDGMAPVRGRGSSDGGVLGRLVAPLRLGGAELLPTMAKLYGALGVRSLRSSALQQLGATLLKQSARYETALAALCKTGIRTAEKRLAVQAASNNLTVAAARYSAVRGALGMLGPLMWTYFGTDLALKALGTDYSRLVRAIFALCQIRLLRTHGFVNA
ncbi:g10419 [Coccomyxa viridis]|uniref:G10419 protein n=1 Tax=Coccomyxa viridis TaxID=1274662 RepID=A0ABP1G6N1_9CHLO